MNTEAIIFFGDNNVIKEMLYPEFEAILDHVVGIPEFAGQSVKAAYLQINSSLQAKSAVLFHLGFDTGGNADSSWNLPLQHLAEKAGRGPDLGAGPIKLACRSQCPVSWHQRELWDPDTDGKPSTFEKITALLKRNRLALAFDEPAPAAESEVPVLSNQAAVTASLLESEIDDVRKKLYAEFKQRQSELLDEQKLRIATLKSEARDHVEKLHRHYRAEIGTLKDQLEKTEQEIIDEQNKNRRYKETLEKQAMGLHQEREKLQKTLEQAKTVEAQEIASLQQKFDQELQATVDTATAELKEMLEMRDVELFYREEQMSSLRDEISQLRTEKQALLGDGGDQYPSWHRRALPLWLISLAWIISLCRKVICLIIWSPQYLTWPKSMV